MLPYAVDGTVSLNKIHILKSSQYLPVPQRMSAFGDRILKKVIKLKWGHQSGS